MANKKVQVEINLDFTSDTTSVDKIEKSIKDMKTTVELNLDPAAAEKIKEDIDTLGRVLQSSLNKSTGKIDLKRFKDNLESNGLEVDKLANTLDGVGIKGKKSFNEVTKANQYLQGELKTSDSILTRMGTTLANTIRWNISASVVNATTGAFREMYYFAKDLDRTLTNIRIVSGESASNMDRFAIAANKSAKALSVSTLDYAEAATLFYQQGLRGSDVLNMTEASIMAANITGESAAEMSNLLTAVMNGYKVATEDVLAVTDKLAAVGATTAADFNELATGMSKVASMANAAGVPLDSLNAQLATIVSVTREAPESIGTSLKTIYGRMLMFKNNATSMMEDEDGELFGAPSVEKALQAYSKATGAQISLFKTTADGRKELRDLGTVIEEIGNSWDKTTDKTAKFGIATALAGSRQQNRLVALFDSWEMYQEAMETSLNAEGTTLQQNQLYLDSYEGRIKGLQAAKEELYMVLMNTDGLKDFISAMTKGVELVTKIADVTGGIYGVIGLIGSAIAGMGIEKISDNLGAIKNIGKREDFAVKLEGKEEEQAKALLAIERTLGKERAEQERQQMIYAKNKRENFAIQLDNLKKEQDNLKETSDIMKVSNMGLVERKQNLEASKKVNEEIGVSNKTLDEIIKTYSDLETAENNLIKARAEENKGEIQKSDQKVQELKAKVDALKADIDAAHGQTSKNVTATETNLGESTKFEKETHDNLLKTAQAGEKLQKTIFGIQTAIMTMPAIINTINDGTKDTTDVLKTAGAVAVPAVLNGLMKFAPAISSAAAEAGGFVKLLATAGPVAALGAAALGVTLVVLKQIVDEAKAFEIAFNEMEEASGKAAQAEGVYKNVLSEIDQLIEKQKELQKVGTPDSEKEIADIEKKIAVLREEETLQHFLMDLEREKAHLAAMTAAEETRKSESVRDRGRAAKLSMEEDMEQTIALYEESSDTVALLTEELEELRKSGEANTSQGKNKLKQLEMEIEKQTELKLSIANLSTELIEVRNNIDDSTDEGKAAIKVLDQSIEKSQGVMRSISGLKDETGEYITALEALEGAFDNINDEYDKHAEALEDSINLTEEYRDILEDLTSKEGLSAASKEKIILKHQELLPYLDDEQELRRQLIQIIEAEEEAQRIAYENMIMTSTDFFDAKIKGNKDLVDKLGEYYDADLENAKSLAEAKAIVEAKLIDNLASQWAKFYSVDSDGQYTTTVGTGGYIDSEFRNMERTIALERNKIAGLFQDIIGTFGSPDFSGISRNKRSETAKGGSNKGSSKKEAEIKLVEADAYEKVNFQIERQNNLLAENKVQQDLARNDTRKKAELMKKEIELIEGQQKNYKELARIQLAQMKDLENKLSKEGFQFKGEGADRIIADLDAIDGKTEDVKKIFDAYIKLQNSELPKTQLEWEKFKIAVEDVEKSLTSLFETEMKGRMDSSKHYIEQRKHFDDWGADSEIEAWGRVRKYVDKYYYDGEISHKEYMTRVMEIDKEMIAAHEASIDDYEERREKVRNEHIKALNDELQAQRDMLSAIGTIQDKIVQIIRKRGEKQKAALEEAYAEETKLLEENHTKTKERYDDELKQFRDMIQGKIDALDDQYDEEDYVENLNKEREAANELEKQINVLALDDSLTARNKTIALRKDLAKQNEKIAKMQQDRERKLLRKSLQDQLKDKEETVKGKLDLEDEAFEKNKIRAQEEYEKSKEYLEWKYSNEQVYIEASQALGDDNVEYINGQFMSITKAFNLFENEFGEGMGILGDIVRDDFAAELEKARRGLIELRDEAGRITRPRDNYESNHQFSDKELGWREERPPAYSPVRPPNRDLDLGYGAATGQAARDNEKRLEDEAYLRSEIKRTLQVIKDRKYAGLDVSIQEKYLARLRSGSYKHGGKITDTGIVLNEFHGTKSNPEWIFNDQQLKNIIKDVTISAMKVTMPKLPNIPSMGNTGGNKYDITFDIKGNMDRSIMPEVQKMITTTIKKTQENKISKYKDVGIKRPVY